MDHAASAADHAAAAVSHATRDALACFSPVPSTQSVPTPACAAEPANPEAQRPADWAGLPAELLRQIAAAIMASDSTDWSATLAARNALRLTCRAWRDACPVRLRLLNSLPGGARRRSAWRRMQYPGLDALAAAVSAAIRNAAGGVLGRSTFASSRHLSGLPSAPACAAVRAFMARLGRRARKKLLSEVVRRAAVNTPEAVAWLWRSWLRRLPACTVTLDLRWSHVAVSDDMDPLGSPAGRGSGGLRAGPADARASAAVKRLPVWYLAEVAQGVLPLAVTELIELCEGLHQVKSVTIPMLNRANYPAPAFLSSSFTQWRRAGGTNYIIVSIAGTDAIDFV